MARRFVAPGSTYVCADAATTLPFVDGAFSAAVCTDAFHYLPDPAVRLADLRRCAGTGPVVLDRVGNRLQEPRDTDSELTPQGYLDLVGTPGVRMVGQDELVDDYLAGRGPQLAEPRSAERFLDQKWLSLVVSDGEFLDAGPMDPAPHGQGPLGIHPLLHTTEVDGEVQLRFAFPSTWYAFENAQTLSYTAPGVRLTPADHAAAASGHRSDELVRRFVQLGMPPAYVRPHATPKADGTRRGWWWRRVRR